MGQCRQVMVWDPVVRIGHWGLAGVFGAAQLLEDAVLHWHVALGYAGLMLVLTRLVWGFVGPRHARFSDFVASPREVLVYLRQVVTFRAVRHVGHNPAGGAMVLALLLGMLLTGVTGVAAYGAMEYSGPLAEATADLRPAAAVRLKGLHEVAASTVGWLVILHLAGVAVASFQHRENLVAAMFTGRKRRSQEEER